MHEVSQRRFVLVSADHPIVSAISVRTRSLLSPLQHSLTMLFACAGECRQVRAADALSPCPGPVLIYSRLCACALTRLLLLPGCRWASAYSPLPTQMPHRISPFLVLRRISMARATPPAAAQDLPHPARPLHCNLTAHCACVRVSRRNLVYRCRRVWCVQTRANSHCRCH